MAKDRAHDAHRVPNVAAPIVWQKDTEEFYEPHRHTSVGDKEAAAAREAEHRMESNKN